MRPSRWCGKYTYIHHHGQLTSLFHSTFCSPALCKISQYEALYALTFLESSLSLMQLISFSCNSIFFVFFDKCLCKCSGTFHASTLQMFFTRVVNFMLFTLVMFFPPTLTPSLFFTPLFTRYLSHSSRHCAFICHSWFSHSCFESAPSFNNKRGSTGRLCG